MAAGSRRCSGSDEPGGREDPSAGAHADRVDRKIVARLETVSAWLERYQGYSPPDAELRWRKPCAAYCPGCGAAKTNA